MTEEHPAPNGAPAPEEQPSEEQPVTEQGVAEGAAAETATCVISRRPKLRIFFDGLFFFCFNRKKGRCKIGVAANAPDHLQLMIIEEVRGGVAQPPTIHFMTPDLLRHIRRVKLDFNNAVPSEATPYLSSQRFDRSTDRGHPNDFRWVLDFENSELHNYEIGKRPNVLRPVLVIEGGCFYTDEKDENPFARKRNREPAITFTKYGPVAQTVAMDVDVADPGWDFEMRLSLKLRRARDETSFEVKFERDVSYRVYLFNVCPERLTQLALTKYANLFKNFLSEKKEEHGKKDHRLLNKLSSKLAAMPGVRDLIPAMLSEIVGCRARPGGDIEHYYEAFDIVTGDRFEFAPVIFDDPGSPVQISGRGILSVAPLICYAAFGGRSASLPGDDESLAGDE